MPPNGLCRAVGEGERNFLNSPSRGAGARTGARQPLLPPYQPTPLLYQPYPLPYQLYPVTYQLYLRPATADTRKSRTTFWKVLRLFHRYSCLSASNSHPARGNNFRTRRNAFAHAGAAGFYSSASEHWKVVPCETSPVSKPFLNHFIRCLEVPWLKDSGTA